jgi:hypothetical protein
MEFEQVIEQVGGVGSLATKPEKEALFSAMCRSAGPVLVVGVFSGFDVLMAALIYESRGLTDPIYGIDLFPTFHESLVTRWYADWINRHPEAEGFPGFYEYVADKCTRFPNVALIQGDSRVIGQTWNKSLGLLVIDGGHDYHTCSSDLECFAPWVQDGGEVWVHDYGMGWPEVVIAVDKFIQDNQFDEPDESYYLLNAIHGTYAVMERK